MKWDPGRSNDVMARGWHQYATDVAWPRKIAALMQQCYAVGTTPNDIFYIIPKFNM
jgi:beta-N-acetylglucosaminidase